MIGHAARTCPVQRAPVQWKPSLGRVALQLFEWNGRAKGKGQRPEQFTGVHGAVYHLYQEEMWRRCRVDFADMPMMALDLLQRDHAVRASVQAKYSHFMIDEFQV